jgi:multidrug resistance efflux pump
MRRNLTVDISESMDMGVLLHMRVPKIVHRTTFLLVLLLAAALAWMALSKANLVVQASGRVRPATSMGQTFDEVSHEINSEVGGRVVAVHVGEGDAVRAGDVLMRTDAERLDNQVEKLHLQIRAGEEERTHLEHFERLLAQRYASARRKAEAELAQAQRQLREGEKQQAAEIRLAQIDLEQWEDKETRARQLAARGLISAAEQLEVVTQTRKAREKWHQAQLPLDHSPVRVLERAVELVQREYEVARSELVMKRHERQTLLDATKVELASLRLQRAQTVVRAPTDGIVTKATVKVGDIMQPGQVGMALAPQRGFAFEAIVPSADVAHLQSGMPVRLKLDAYPYPQYGAAEGILRFISPDSDVVKDSAIYTVKIELIQDKIGGDQYRGVVKLGMTGQAEIVTGKESILSLLVRQLGQKFTLG